MHYWRLLIFGAAFLCPGFVAMSQSKKAAEVWFNKHEWLNADTVPVKYDGFGRPIEKDEKPLYLDLTKLKPHPSINKEEFARQYHGNKRWWNEAFDYLRETDLAALRPGKYLIDGENVFATVTEGPLKMIDTTRFESHKNYQDIHYVISGKEKIGVAQVSSAKLVKGYDAAKDIMFYSANGKYYTADSGNYFIFFPQDGHRPGLQVNGGGADKKIVVKVRRVAE